MAARPIWEGHLRLSLVSCPVALYGAAARGNAISFHLINPETGSRIRMLTVDGQTGDEVKRSALIKGFEVEKGRTILLTDEEIKAVRLESTRTIDIERFVDSSAIDRIWWDEPYYLTPSGKAGIEAFAVIREAMQQAGRIGLGRVVMQTRERIVAIEPRESGMLVTTLRAHDEIRSSADLFADIPAPTIDPRMIDIAGQIIAQLAGPFDPSAFTDRYEDALRALIRSKDGGDGGGAAATPVAQDNVVDLMEALRRSLHQDQPAKAAAAATERPPAKRAPAPKTAASRKAPAKSRAAAR